MFGKCRLIAVNRPERSESLQGVVRLKGASSDGTILRAGEGSAFIIPVPFHHKK
ncbi:MAG: hypothetical protein AABY06_01845 [Nanoarchaeota archaeon]